MEEFHYYLLFLFAWVFFQSLWLSKLSKTVAALADRKSVVYGKSVDLGGRRTIQKKSI